MIFTLTYDIHMLNVMTTVVDGNMIDDTPDDFQAVMKCATLQHWYVCMWWLDDCQMYLCMYIYYRVFVIIKLKNCMLKMNYILWNTKFSKNLRSTVSVHLILFGIRLFCLIGNVISKKPRLACENWNYVRKSVKTFPFGCACNLG